MEARSLINQSRYKQTANQVQQIQKANPDSEFAIANYADRDSYTGRRLLTTADGGTVQASYLSNSQPLPVPSLVTKGQLGVSGFMQQKPAGK